MDIENGYFLAKFQNVDDYDKVLTQGPWIVYGQYLTIQPWTNDFSPLVEYDFLPVIRFSCCKYGHNKDMCTTVVMDRNLKKRVERMTVVTRETDKEDGRAL
ncbi:hypothetical protein Gogos_017002, partial [Gossypium gossypioides]|nr:hypothetical protein [Gossypium gossypioides]